MDAARSHPQRSSPPQRENRTYGSAPVTGDNVFFTSHSHGRWKEDLFSNCPEFALSCLFPWCLIGHRSQYLGYNWLTNLLCTMPLFFRDRTARHLGIARPYVGLFHTDLGACGLIALPCLLGDRHTQAASGLFNIINALLLAQASAEAAAANRGIVSAPVPSPADRLRGVPHPADYPLGGHFGNNEWSTTYWDVCASGAFVFLASAVVPNALLAYEKAQYDDSAICFNFLFVTPCALREELRAQHGIAVGGPCPVGTCGTLAPCMSDLLGALLPCGTVQAVSQMRRPGGLGRYFVDDIYDPPLLPDGAVPLTVPPPQQAPTTLV